MGNWSQSKEPLDVLGQSLVEGEPSKAHHCPLRVAHIEQFIMSSVVQHIVQHGRKVLLGMLIKPRCMGNGQLQSPLGPAEVSLVRWIFFRGELAS